MLVFATINSGDPNFMPTYIRLTIFSAMSSGTILGASIALNEGEKQSFLVYIGSIMFSLGLWFTFRCLDPIYLRILWRIGISEAYFVVASWMVDA
jgi:hypothetical protein